MGDELVDFVGRETELEHLAELADKVRSGDPRVVCVRGVPGIGKTAMVRRFAAGLRDFTVLAATADPSEEMVEYGVVGQLVRRVPAAATSGAPLLAGALPVDAGPFVVGAQLLDVLGALQAHGSVCIVVDDVQWADTASLQALGFVLRRIWADQVLVVVVARPVVDERAESLLRAGPTVTTIELSGLAAAEVARLSTAIAGEELPPGTVERLRSLTGGHPLYLRTLLTEPESAVPGGRPQVPPSLVAAVRTALIRLPEPSQDMVEALAVLGAPGPLARAAQVAGVRDPAAALQPALAAGLAQWWPEEPSSPVGLVHQLQREAIHTGLSPTRRRELHRRAAAVVDPDAAWTHRVAAASTADEPLAADLETAADEQAARGHHGMAARYLQWAADLSPDRTEHERRFLTAGVQVLFSSERLRAAPLWPAMERCGHSALRSLCLGMTSLFVKGEWAAAQRWFTESVELSANPGVPRWIPASAAAGLAAAHTWGGRVEESIDAARLAMSTGELPVRLHDYTQVVLAVAVARSAGLPEGLAELAGLPEHPGAVPADRLDSLACRGALATMLGRYPEGRRDLRDVVARQRLGTFMTGETVPHSYLAAGHYQLGEWDEAVAVMEQARTISEVDEQLQNQAIRRMVSTFVPAGRGNWAEAAEHVRAAQQIAQRIGGPQDLRYAAIADAVLLQARVDHARMLTALDRVPGLDVHGIAEEDGAHRWWDLWWRPLVIEAALGVGRVEAAAAHLTRLRAQADDVPHIGATLARLTAWHLAATGDTEGALAEAERFLAVPVRPSAPFAEGLLQHDHARRLLGRGDNDRALTALRSAKRLFGALAATPFERRVDADLVRCGEPTAPGAPHRAVTAMTNREWEVARLVTRGLTNREIAAHLYVTTKTVEYHLGNIYAKLGISSRRALRERLSAPDAGTP